MFLFSVSGFPVIMKFQPATCNLQNKPAAAKWLIRRHSLCGCYRFRETHEVMRQRPDPMIGGLVYETFSLVCAEFQITSVGGSSHQ